MHLTAKLAVIASVAVAGLAVSASVAQDVNAGNLAGNLERLSRQQDLDSYWLDNRMWTEYGFRSHVKTVSKPFTNLPSYFAGRNYYSYGVDLPDPRLENELDPEKPVLFRKDGTWY